MQAHDWRSCGGDTWLDVQGVCWRSVSACGRVIASSTFSADVLFYICVCKLPAPQEMLEASLTAPSRMLLPRAPPQTLLLSDCAFRPFQDQAGEARSISWCGKQQKQPLRCSRPGRSGQVHLRARGIAKSHH